MYIIILLCSPFGGAEDRWNIAPFCSFSSGAGTGKTERARVRPVRGKGIRGSIWRADTVMLHVPGVCGAPLACMSSGHEQAPG
jgi:hypothetical protein